MTDMSLDARYGQIYCKGVNIAPLPIDGERTIAFLSKVFGRDDTNFEAPAYKRGLSFISAKCKY